ncbi:MAG: ABC transporter ATP-binding protein [Clostridia bacterium]|nr:ABC transporter ATP-binding protein [Clostridia bacterium]MBQ4604675.1 ABC transporter ATP-binding protein [Clostridia bacterium]
MKYKPYKKDKIPVIKNIIFALRIVWEADKRMIISAFVTEIANNVLSMYVQNILFLKVLLSIIDGKAEFKTYFVSLLLFFGAYLVTNAVSAYSARTRLISTKVVLKKLNNKIFTKAIGLDVGCYENPEFYDKYTRATQVVSSSHYETLCYCVASIIGGIIALICVVTTVTLVNPMYLIFLLPVTLVFTVEHIKSKVAYNLNNEMTTNNRIKAYIQRTMLIKDYSKDMRTSNIFAVMLQRFKTAIDANIVILKKYGLKLFLYSMLSSLFSDFIPIIGTYAFAGYQFVFTKTLTISGFSVVLSSINAVRQSTMNIARNYERLTQTALYFQHLRDFFDYKPEITDGGKDAEEFECIEFRNVSFGYPGTDKTILKNISFRIEKGETVAVVGVNGAGKSTLVKLLLRFYDADEGEILYNGINIKEYNLTSLRSAYATVFQDYRNFAVSVNENIICHECTVEEKKLAEKALIQSGVWDKISSLPKGADTVLTREFDVDGVGLSGGENQKVSVARLFARDFQIAILDEPSSALDPVAEYKMYENLIKVTENKTVIYISHRLSSAVLSDRIIVLGDGKIIESGNHSELMANNGEYSRMFTLQASSYKGESEVSENV